MVHCEVVITACYMSAKMCTILHFIYPYSAVLLFSIKCRCIEISSRCKVYLCVVYVCVCVCGICNNGVDMAKSFEYDRGIHRVGRKMFGTPKIY